MFTAAQHQAVMFQTCPRCKGRVVWGDGDFRHYSITGIRGHCLMCPFEVYTMDLLKDKKQKDETERLSQFLRGAA